MSSWKEANDAEGRVYYYNADSGETTWDKPRELFTQLELKLEKHGWKTGKTDEGQVYYYNQETGKSCWEIPTFEEHGEEEEAERPHTSDERSTTPAQSNIESYVNNSIILNAPVMSQNEAEHVFMEMLKEHQIDSTWSFNKIISELGCKDPRYWCVDDDPLWKSQAFEKYLSNRSEDQLLKEHSAVNKFKAAFTAMLSQNKDIRYYTRWTTAKRLFANEPIYKHSVVSERTKRQVFQDYVDDLRRNQSEELNKTKQQAKTELQDYLESIMPDKKSLLSWQELSTKYLFENSTRFTSNRHFQALSKHDVLMQYITIVEAYTSKTEEELKKLKSANYTKDRIARDHFKELLAEHSKSIRCNSKWEDLYSLFKSDSRFLSLLGRNGSSALDLFMDLVEEKANIMKAQKSIANQILIDTSFQWSSDAVQDREKVNEILSKHQQLNSLDTIDRGILVDKMIDDQNQKRAQQAEMIQRLLEQRKKYFLLLLQRVFSSPNAKPETWEKARDVLKGYPEYIDIKEESVKEQIFKEFEPAKGQNTAAAAATGSSALAAPQISRKRQMTPVELDY
ncbi:snoRNA-splicing protein PRP40 [Lachancea thermotolerans CBS 6340]|uniref:KLTH0C00924p n=1 Tax=Lachancea thermotolerans (strain ATCC 56472 / CBS 6340 / NRRL Y-8284) TaxID=559295 RepID=C5DDH0_LACTC|nr:KLTH0C00924p [Lachancea thermotolerans CBS 6340]CAR21831.1 KLTH0C00924p [Lachancea thermotolerans CBS 6340]